MSDRSVLDLSIREVGAGYRDGSWTPVAVTEAALSRIGATEPLLHAWAAIDAERALEAAAVAQRELAAGMDRGPLHGIPVGVKDIFDVAGLPTRCGSAARADALPAMEDAVAVGAWRQAGAVILGKTTTQEFAAGVVSPPARNPWDPTRIPGGSSGGSAAAAAVGACFGALGSDTGGSIRIPAAACGVAGFKPAFGRLSVEGVYPLSWSLDTIGPLARTVADTRLLWDALRGDVRFVAGDGTPGSDGPFRVGVSRPYFWDGLQSDVRSAVDAALATMQEAGIAVVAVDWPLAAAARAGAFIINRVETAAVHERVAREEPERFAQYGRELQLRVAAGREIPAGAYIEAQRARPLVRDAMAALFTLHRLDAIVAPTLPTTAPAAENPIVSGTGRDESLGAAWTRLTMPFNATGQPVLALPCGRDQEGLPIGLQLAGRPGQEAVLFDLGQAVEAALGWQPEAPPLAVGRREAGTARMG